MSPGGSGMVAGSVWIRREVEGWLIEDSRITYIVADKKSILIECIFAHESCYFHNGYYYASVPICECKVS